MILKQIDKTKYPKIARKWSWSVIFVYPVFVIANKLWFFLYLYIILNLMNFILLVLKIDGYIADLVSVAIFAIFIFFTIYLLIYGRSLAWQKLGYQETEQNIARFKLRQRIVTYVNIIIIGLGVIYFLYLLEYGHWLSVLNP